MFRRILAFLLCVSLSISEIPVMAAENGQEEHKHSYSSEFNGI